MNLVLPEKRVCRAQPDSGFPPSQLLLLPTSVQWRILDLLDARSLVCLSGSCRELRTAVSASADPQAALRWRRLCQAKLGPCLGALHEAFARHQMRQRLRSTPISPLPPVDHPRMKPQQPQSVLEHGENPHFQGENRSQLEQTPGPPAQQGQLQEQPQSQQQQQQQQQKQAQSQLQQQQQQQQQEEEERTTSSDSAWQMAWHWSWEPPPQLPDPATLPTRDPARTRISPRGSVGKRRRSAGLRSRSGELSLAPMAAAAVAEGYGETWFWQRLFGAAVRPRDVQWWPEGGNALRQSLITSCRAERATSGGAVPSAGLQTAQLLPLCRQADMGMRAGTGGGAGAGNGEGEEGDAEWPAYDESAAAALEMLERTGHSATQVGELLVVIGGLSRQGQATIDVLVFHLASLAAWRPVVHTWGGDALPRRRFRHTTALIHPPAALRAGGFAQEDDPILFMFGGYDLEGNVHGMEEAFFLCLSDAGATATWRRAHTRGTVPSARFHHAMTAYANGSKVLVYGGEGLAVNDWDVVEGARQEGALAQGEGGREHPEQDEWRAEDERGSRARRGRQRVEGEGEGAVGREGEAEGGEGDGHGERRQRLRLQPQQVQQVEQQQQQLQQQQLQLQQQQQERQSEVWQQHEQQQQLQLDEQNHSGRGEGERRQAGGQEQGLHCVVQQCTLDERRRDQVCARGQGRSDDANESREGMNKRRSEGEGEGMSGWGSESGCGSESECEGTRCGGAVTCSDTPSNSSSSGGRCNSSNSSRSDCGESSGRCNNGALSVAGADKGGAAPSGGSGSGSAGAAAGADGSHGNLPSSAERQSMAVAHTNSPCSDGPRSGSGRGSGRESGCGCGCCGQSPVAWERVWHSVGGEQGNGRARRTGSGEGRGEGGHGEGGPGEGEHGEGGRALVVYVLDVGSMTWSRVPTHGVCPGVRILHFATTYTCGASGREHMVIFGGYRDDSTNLETMQPYALHLASMEWCRARSSAPTPAHLPESHRAVAYQPVARNRSGLTKVGNDTLLLTEGTIYDTRSYLRDVHALHLPSLSWSPVRAHGQPTAGPSGGLTAEGLIAYGGCVLGTLGIQPVARVDPMVIGSWGALSPPQPQPPPARTCCRPWLRLSAGLSLLPLQPIELVYSSTSLPDAAAAAATDAAAAAAAADAAMEKTTAAHGAGGAYKGGSSAHGSDSAGSPSEEDCSAPAVGQVTPAPSGVDDLSIWTLRCGESPAAATAGAVPAATLPAAGAADASVLFQASARAEQDHAHILSPLCHTAFRLPHLNTALLPSSSLLPLHMSPASSPSATPPTALSTDAASVHASAAPAADAVASLSPPCPLFAKTSASQPPDASTMAAAAAAAALDPLELLLPTPALAHTHIPLPVTVSRLSPPLLTLSEGRGGEGSEGRPGGGGGRSGVGAGMSILLAAPDEVGAEAGACAAVTSSSASAASAAAAATGDVASAAEAAEAAAQAVAAVAAACVNIALMVRDVRQSLIMRRGGVGDEEGDAGGKHL
ncbi:unnamed protein product [Closterium sp. NIES-53]